MVLRYFGLAASTVVLVMGVIWACRAIARQPATELRSTAVETIRHLVVFVVIAAASGVLVAAWGTPSWTAYVAGLVLVGAYAPFVFRRSLAVLRNAAREADSPP